MTNSRVRTFGPLELESRATSESGHQTWETLSGECLTGFSHGAAGIVYALLRLFEATGDAAFLEAATGAIGYERAVFRPEVGNWPDLRRSSSSTKEDTFMTSWCHGAPGIGLARLGGLLILDDSEARRELDIALETTLASSALGLDHLCCGNFGRIAFLFTAARQLCQADLRDAALKRASWVVTRARERGSYLLSARVSRGFYNPGFFQGIAGIGYQLLRLGYPDSLPSVLLWE